MTDGLWKGVVMSIIIGSPMNVGNEPNLKTQFSNLVQEQREMFETILQDRISGKVFTEEVGGTKYTQSGINQKMMENLHNPEYQMAARRKTI